ncbi:chemotaxis protein CheD [Haloarculaceae archaeon H-GB1-1]|nr:chemotaxis protein CheD [Haloarculaceae archaeon H-GB1-1]
MKVYDGQSDTESQTEPRRIKVGIAEYKITSGEAVLTTSGLGSCLGVAIYDLDAGVAGLVHVMLPSAEEMNDGNAAKFADAGIEVMVEAMEAEGADRSAMEAKVAGGSDMLDFSENGSGIGVRNIETVRETLSEFGIPLAEEDVGGDHGRSVRLEARTGDFVIKSANKESVTL